MLRCALIPGKGRIRPGEERSLISVKAATTAQVVFCGASNIEVTQTSPNCCGRGHFCPCRRRSWRCQSPETHEAHKLADFLHSCAVYDEELTQ